MAKKPKRRAKDEASFILAQQGILPTGADGSLQQPFNLRRAVDYFRGKVYACLNLNANQVASQRLRLYTSSAPRKRKAWHTRKITKRQLNFLDGANIRQSGGIINKVQKWHGEVEEIVDNHPIMELLHKVNPSMDSYQFRYLQSLYSQITGSSYTYHVADEYTGLPVELWPMPSQWTRVIPGDVNLIDGFLFGRTPGEEMIFGLDEVWQFKRPHPNNPYYGMGLIEAGWGVVQLETATQQTHLSLMANQARPDYVIIFKNAAPSDIKRIQSDVVKMMAGPRNAGKFLAMNGEAEFQQLNFAPKEWENSDQILEEISMVFGPSVTMLKSNDPNRANAEQGDLNWLRNHIWPMCIMDQENLNQNLLPLFGEEMAEECFLAYDNPIPENEKNVLQGPQLQAAVNLITNVNNGTVPRDSAIGILSYFYNLEVEDAASLVGSAGTTPPEPTSKSIHIKKFNLTDAEQVVENMDLDLESLGFGLDELLKGLNVELEHQELTGGDLMMTAQIALDHLNEDPEYYDKLAQMEKQNG